MIKSLNHIAIIVSCEEALDFYKKLGFKEIHREFKPEKNQTIIFYKNDTGITLEIFIKEGLEHNNSPEQKGLRHLAFDIENVDEIKQLLKDYEVQKDYVMANGKRISFIYDYDKQPIEFAEIGSIGY